MAAVTTVDREHLPHPPEAPMPAATVGPVLALALAFANVNAAAGQAGELLGTTRLNGDSSRVLSGVDIALVPSGRQVRSDPQGRFRFDSLKAGSYLLHARRLGFAAESTVVRVAEARETSIVLMMRPLVQSLASVRVDGERMPLPARFADAYARAARGFGRAFDRALIDSLQPLDVKSLLQLVPGVQVSSRGVTFQRCQAGLLGAASAGSLTPPDRFGGIATNPQGEMSGAHVHVYVDGTRRTRYSTLASTQFDAEHALREISPATIQLMEVYSGVARIPGEFLDDACAVILIWTKAY